MAALPPLQVFHDIPVVPVRSVSHHIAHGGPIWPAFDQQLDARHCRDRVAVDRHPHTPDATVALREPAIWGGFLNPQFGHLIVEQLTRLPQSLVECPGEMVLFTVPPAGQIKTVPAWVWQVLDWYGLPRDRVRLVDRALVADELRVAAQGEMMGKSFTSEAYLDLLDANMARHALTADKAHVVFVTRAGLVARGQGGHAGEAYLADVLGRAGVRVVDPAQMKVASQLAIYAGAGVLVFSEGSAIHGRLLLGRIAQDIHVLRRRPRRDLAAEQLTPRCNRLRYHAAVGHRFGARMPNGTDRLDLTAATYDLDVVFDLFAGLGHDPRPYWDEAAYRAAVVHDLRGWLTTCQTHRDQLLANLALVASAGFNLDKPLTLPPRAQPDDRPRAEQARP